MQNPYAIYVYCDASMDYDSQNTGGVGFQIIFPDCVQKDNIKESVGKFVHANIERLELEAIISSMETLVDIYQKGGVDLSGVGSIVVVTDRLALCDTERTYPYKIQEWRKNNWCNHEGKEIKNSDLLDRLDKKRKKLSELVRGRVSIEYRPSKLNRTADKLAKAGKDIPICNNSIAIGGLKVGKRKDAGREVTYRFLRKGDEIDIRIFLKRPIRNQWEISAEICEGANAGQKLKIYTDYELAEKLHRHHEFRIRLKKVYSHHIEIFRSIKELKAKHDGTIHLPSNS
jgi:ribonuclease HI